MQILQETYLSVIKQSLNESFFDPSFCKNTSESNELCLPPDISLIIERILKYQKRDPVLKFVSKGISENSKAFVKTHVITASRFLEKN